LGCGNIDRRDQRGVDRRHDISRISMRDHWTAGYIDSIRTLRHPEALQRPADPTGVATFDVAVDGRG
jgi:NTE family protein